MEGNVKSQQGFTLIELVTVVVLLGILSSVAIPKYINMQIDAHKATVNGVAGALSSGVNMLHNKWYIKRDHIVLSNGHTLFVNSNGFPVSTSGATTLSSPAHCVHVWRELLSASVSATTYNGNSYLATIASSSANTCNYVYQDYANMGVIYNSLTGAVSAY